MANTRKYTSVKKFAAAVEKYLRSIRTKSVVYEVDSYGNYVRDKSGAKVPAKDMDGNPMYVETYVVPPELHDIADAVGMCYDTWLKYASGEYGEGYAEVCAAAKEICLRWTLREMHTRTKGVDAMKWVLQVNYGMRETKEVELGAATRKTLEVSSLTMEEKLARLSSMPELLSQIYDAGEESAASEGEQTNEKGMSDDTDGDDD